MKKSNTLTLLTLLVAIFAIAYSGIGLFSKGGPGPHDFVTLHGQTVEIYGQGIYRNDAAFKAPIFRGTDAVTLFLCVPVLLIALFWYRHGSLRGGCCSPVCWLTFCITPSRWHSVRRITTSC